jgi:hypothetical protein
MSSRVLEGAVVLWPSSKTGSVLMLTSGESRSGRRWAGDKRGKDDSLFIRFIGCIVSRLTNCAGTTEIPSVTCCVTPYSLNSWPRVVYWFGGLGQSIGLSLLDFTPFPFPLAIRNEIPSESGL